MRVKHARDVMARHTASNLASRQPWQRAALLLARGFASSLRIVVCAPVWGWLGAKLREAVVQLERWVYRR